MTEEELLIQFKNDVAKFSGNYDQFLIIAKTSKQMLWKSTDDTWGVGAAKRFMDVVEERDRLEENLIQEGD